MHGRGHHADRMAPPHTPANTRSQNGANKMSATLEPRSNHPRDGGKPWDSAEDEIIIEIVAEARDNALAEGKRYTFPKERIQEVLRSRGWERTLPMIRNRHQRLEKGLTLPPEKFKNMCRKCNVPQRGHICKMGSAAKRARNDNLPLSRDDKPPPLRRSADAVRYDREEMEMAHVPYASTATSAVQGGSAARMPPPQLTRSRSKEDPGDRMPPMRGGHGSTISLVINEDFNTMERIEMAEQLAYMSTA